MPTPQYANSVFDPTGQALVNADDARAQRMFVGLFNQLLAPEQTNLGDDSVLVNRGGQYVITTPGIGTSVVGQPVSDQQPRVNIQVGNSAASLSPQALLVLGLVAWFVLK